MQHSNLAQTVEKLETINDSQLRESGTKLRQKIKQKY